MYKKIIHNWSYFLWFLFYFILFWLIFGASSKAFIYLLIIYGVSIGISLTSFGEGLFRVIYGVRHLRTEQENELLMPIFNEVYENAKKVDEHIFNKVEIFILDTMEINAFASGRSTLVITRGSIELLNQEALYGLVAHEFGHFSNYDTVALLIATIGNITLTIFIKIVTLITYSAGKFMPNEDKTFIVNLICKILDLVQKIILFIGDMILMPVSRKSEFKADHFAYQCGYGDELLYALKQFNMLSINEPQRFIEQLRSTHPPLSERIASLEKLQKTEKIEHSINIIRYDTKLAQPKLIQKNEEILSEKQELIRRFQNAIIVLIKQRNMNPPE